MNEANRQLLAHYVAAFDVEDGRITGICHFFDTAVFAQFGLPAQLTTP